jgi:hypothetical protein
MTFRTIASSSFSDSRSSPNGPGPGDAGDVHRLTRTPSRATSARLAPSEPHLPCLDSSRCEPNRVGARTHLGGRQSYAHPCTAKYSPSTPTGTTSTGQPAQSVAMETLRLHLGRPGLQGAKRGRTDPPSACVRPGATRTTDAERESLSTGGARRLPDSRRWGKQRFTVPPRSVPPLSDPRCTCNLRCHLLPTHTTL